MKKIIKYVLFAVVALGTVACESGMNGGPTSPHPDVRPTKPTVPLKRRPIVPTSKLPRPRVADIYQSADGSVAITLSPDVESAVIEVTSLETGSVVRYIFTESVIRVDVPVGNFEIAVETDSGVEIYTNAEV